MQSHYENLQVYKKALDMVIYFENIIRHFEKYHKYTIGADLRNLSRNALVLIAKANTKANRQVCLKEAIDKLEELKILIHVAKEIKAFRSFKNFEFAAKLVIEVLKQCEGWNKSQNFSG
ncbi:MAG TPA: four helix bundle protein [Candidatus Omnitrophota bacterium]|nr:four helix bundle protein [Candidatus Omnitrophota bacterium]